VETSVRRPTGTDEMDVDSSYVLFVDNDNKNESAKLTFFAAMDHQSVGILGGKVEEYTPVRGREPRIRPPQTPYRGNHASFGQQQEVLTRGREIR
jgi:predicted double-glycine peptidase